MDWTRCPQCGAVAVVQWRTVMDSTDGPVEHCRVTCLQRHWFLLPTAALSSGEGRAARAEDPRAARRRPVS